MKGVEEIAEMVRMDIERFFLAEMVHHYSMSMKEVETICNFARTLYIANREDKKSEKKPNK